MSSLQLEINASRYSGWEGGSVTRTFQDLAGSVELAIFDHSATQSQDWPIYEEDAYRILIDGEQVGAGYIDAVSGSFSATSREFGVRGRDKAAALIDNSALLDRWSFRNANVVDIARKVAAPFGVPVSVQSGLELLKAPRKLVVSPGDSAFDVILKASKAAGVMVVSDGAGGIKITRGDPVRASQSLIQGENLIAGNISPDASNRYSRYVVLSQVAGTDTASGGATRIRAEATDEGVRRADRVLVIQPESGQSIAYARQLATWEAQMRQAASYAIECTVKGWRQSDGELWPLNALIHIKSNTLRVDTEMLISQVVHTVGHEGEISGLSLVRPDAFTPAPSARVKA